LALFALSSAHMWIYQPNNNRFGPDGGKSLALSNPGGGNPGHDSAHTMSTPTATNACAGVKWNPSYTTPAMVGQTFSVQWVQTDIGATTWNVYLTNQGDGALVNNMVNSQAGATNSYHNYTITWAQPGNWTMMAVQSTGGYVSCADFVVTGAAYVVAPMIALSAVLAFFAF